MSQARVSAKGAVVIPAAIRRKYGIESGMMVKFMESNGNIRIVPLPKDPIAAAHGFLKDDTGGSLTEMLLEERRRELEREEAVFKEHGKR